MKRLDATQRGGFGGRVHDARVRAGLGQKEMAEKLGLSITGYQRWELGEVAQPNPKHLSKAAEILGVTPAYLLYGESGVSEMDEIKDALAGLRSDVRSLLTQLDDLRPE